MSTKKSENKFYTEKETRLIYVLLSPADKKFYINQSTKKSLRETYRHNLKCRRESTKNFIEEIKPNRPCIFVLEKVYSTKAEAQNYVLVWIKIFLENGYISFNNEKILLQTEQLYFNNIRIYERRKSVNLQNILSCKRCFIPTYKNITCEKYISNNQETEPSK